MHVYLKSKACTHPKKILLSRFTLSKNSFVCILLSLTNKLCCFLYLCISAGNWDLDNFYMRKKSRLQLGEPGASISWDDSYFRLHENFRFGVQEWIRHVVLFWDPWFPIQGSRAQNHWVVLQGRLSLSSFRGR